MLRIFQRNLSLLLYHTIGTGCSYCHQDKHTRDKCFFLHGYPPWHRLYGQPKPKLRSKPPSTVAQVYVQPIHDTETMVKHLISDDKINSDSMPFSVVQCQQIMQLIQAGMKDVTTAGSSHVVGSSHLAGSSHETQFGCQVKLVRSDNGTEFLNNDLTPFLASLGIINQTSGVKTPQQNGVVERKQRHLLDMARALRFYAHLSISFWGDCLLTADNYISHQQVTY